MEFPIELSPKFLLLATELKVKPEDIEEHFTRGGGPGGQKINKTSSCVELRHTPTDTIVRVQKHREQSANRTSAYKLLLLKIEESVKGEESEFAKKRFKIRKQKNRRSRKSKEKILEAKRQRSEVKETRKDVI